MGIVPKKGARWTNLQPILEHVRNMLKPNKQCYRLVLYQAPTHAASIHFSEEPAVLQLSADWSWSISLNSWSWFPAGYQCRNGWVIILHYSTMVCTKLAKFAFLSGKQLLDLDSYHFHSFPTNGKSQPLEKGPYHTLLGGALTDAEGIRRTGLLCEVLWHEAGRGQHVGRKRPRYGHFGGKFSKWEEKWRKYRWNQMKSRGDKFGWRYTQIQLRGLEFSLLFSCVQKLLTALSPPLSPALVPSQFCWQETRGCRWCVPASLSDSFWIHE